MDRLHLLVREDLGNDLVDAEPAPDRFGRPAVVAGDHRDLEPQPMQRGDRLGRRGPDRIGDGDDGRQPTVDRGIKRRLAVPRQPPRLRLEQGDVMTKLRHVAIGPNLNAAPLDRRRDAVARDRFKPRGRTDAQPAILRGGDDRRGDRMFRTRLDAGDQGQHLVAVEAGRGLEIGELGPPRRQRPRLVERDHGHVAKRLERFALAEQDAELGRPAGADHDRRRRGKTHRAGAGDDQHGHGVDQGEAQRRLRTEREPQEEGQGGYGHHRRHEPAGDLVDKRLDRQLRTLRLLDHPDDLGEQGVRPHLGGAKGESAGLVDGGADNLVPCPLGDRDRLAGDHALVDIGGALGHLAVDRHLLAGPHVDDVAGPHFGQRNLGDAAAALDPRRLRLQPDEPLDRLGRAPFRLRLQVAPEKDEGDDDGRGFIIDVVRARGQQAGGEGRHDRIGPGGAGADRHQRIHVRGPPKQSGNPLAEEAQPRTEQHRRGQRELDQPAALHADRPGNEAVQRREEMRTHLEDQHRQGQQRREPCRAAQARELPAPRLSLAIDAARPGEDSARLVATRPDRRLQILD